MSRKVLKLLLKNELIGLFVEVINSNNPYLIGLKGKIIDETKKTFKIETERGRKILPKDVCVFKFILPTGREIIVDGANLICAPEERAKLLQKLLSR